MYGSSYKPTLILAVLLLSACAQLGILDMQRAEIGMHREQAIASVKHGPAGSLKSGPTEYVLFRVIPSFTPMYSDYPYAVYFIRLENDKVVDRGLVGSSEEKRIRQVRPTFVLREWQANSPVSDKQ